MFDGRNEGMAKNTEYHRQAAAHASRFFMLGSNASTMSILASHGVDDAGAAGRRDATAGRRVAVAAAGRGVAVAATAAAAAGRVATDVLKAASGVGGTASDIRARTRSYMRP